MVCAAIAYVAPPLVTQPVAIFLVVLAIILLTPLLLNRLRIPGIIGLIIAGVAVGPYGFNVLARDMSFEVFGQVGILYLMFLAGLEIDMYHLKKNMVRGAVFGLYTFAIPLAAGFAASHWLLGLDPPASMLAATLFSAHTLIGYPIISRFGLTKSPAVIIAIAGTIVTVLLSLVVLASVVGVYRDGAVQLVSMLRLLGGLVAFCAVVWYAYPRLTRWFFKRYADTIMQFVYVLAMVFLASTVASAIGIEGVFGAFFAGLVLNRYIPSRSALMARIEFVGNAIFIPYFLIGVGMLINVGVILNGPATLYVAAVITGVAMAAKWLAAGATQLTFGLSAVDRSVMYQLSNAHTAVALAVVMIGYNLGVFDDNILNGTILMILVTCAVASIGVGRAANRLALSTFSSGAHSPSARPRRSSHTLIPLATPVTARQLVSLAVLMRHPEAEGKFYALHVRSDNRPSSRAIGRNSLDLAVQAAAATDTPLTPIERFDINVVAGVLNTIAERDIDTLVLGLHRRVGIIDSFYGSKIEQLVRSTQRMAVLCRIFIPLNTLRRINVYVPAKAHFEAGFSKWVDAVGNLTRQVGCRVTFYAFPDTAEAVRRVLLHGRYGITFGFHTLERPDDYVLLAGDNDDDFLTVFVTARRESLSYSPALDEMTAFIQRNFAESSIIMLFPEQTGEAPEIPTIAETMTTDLLTGPAQLWKWLKRSGSRRVKQ